MIAVGTKVRVTYGLSKTETDGIILEHREDGKYKVGITVGNTDTYIYSDNVTLVNKDIDWVALGHELNPDEGMPAPEPQKPKKKQVSQVENLFDSVEKKPEPADVKEEDEKPVEEDKWMKPLRYDMDFLGPIPTTYRIAGRQKIRGIRHYVVCFEDQHEPWFLPSVTSVLDKVVPKDDGLVKFMVNDFSSFDEWKTWLDEKASYGTVVHGAIADFVNGVLPDFNDKDNWYAYMTIACERANAKSKANAWTEAVKEAVIDFWKWVHDYEVRIIMLEQPLASRKWGLAGQLDLLVEMNSHIQKKTGKNAGKPHRVLAIVDIKTGEANDRYNAQLGMYDGMLFETFPNIAKIISAKYPEQVVDGAVRLEHGIFTPRPFRKEPKYTFLWRTDKVHEYMEKKFQKHLDLFRMDMKKPGPVRMFTGKPDLSQPLDGVISYRSLEEEWLERIKDGNYGEDTEIQTVDDDDDEES